MGVAFSPYTKNWNGKETANWDTYSVDDIKDMLRVVNTKFSKIATYGMGVGSYNRGKSWDNADANCRVARAAAQINKERNTMALQVLQGIHQIDDNSDMTREIDNAFAAAQDANSIFRNTVSGVTFTNEYFTDVNSGNKILSWIRQYKPKAQSLGLKIGTRIHTCGFITENRSEKNILENIIRESDYIMCNMYPAKEHTESPQRGATEVGNYFLWIASQIKRVKSNIEVIIGETGWPSEGISFNSSPNSPSNLKDYWNRIGQWAANNKIQTYMFEAIDEPWKSNRKSSDPNSSNGPNGAEGHYGWWKRVDTGNGPRYDEK